LLHGLLLLGICAIGAAPVGEDLKDSMIAMLGNEARYKRPERAGFDLRPAGVDMCRAPIFSLIRLLAVVQTPP
jgi:hypothetical protein